MAALVLSPDAGVQAEALQVSHFGDAFTVSDGGWTRLVDRANARRVRRVLQRLLPTRARVLEIGPGRGAVLVALAEAGFRAEGLEVSPAVAEASRRRAAVPVTVGTLDTRATGGAAAYDAVVARHVLEHMADPLSAVDALGRRLAPGGIAYVAVPNVSAPEAALSGWSGYQPYHLHYFTPARLRALFECAGLAVLMVRTREPFSGWFNALVGSLRRRDAAAVEQPATHSGTAVTIYQTARLLFGALSGPLRFVQARSGYGEEIELLARKLAAG